jgi:hypothetical protein
MEILELQFAELNNSMIQEILVKQVKRTIAVKLNIYLDRLMIGFGQQIN